MILAYIVYCGIIIFLVPLMIYPLSSGLGCENKNGIFLCNKIVSYVVPVLILTIVLGMRYNVGVDYLRYEEIYDTQSFQSSHVEPLYAFLSSVLFKLNMPYYVLTCIINCFCFILFFKTFDLFPGLRAWGFIFLLITGTLFVFLNTQRQAITFFLCLYSIRFIQTKSFAKYLLLILVASGFHYTSILLLPLYFIANVKKCILDKILWRLCLFIFCFLFSNHIKDLIFRIVIAFAPSKYAGYGKRILNWEINLGSGNGMLLLHFMDFLTIIILNIVNKQQAIKNNILIAVQRIWLIGTYLDIVFEGNMLLSRIPICMTAFKIIVLAYISNHVFTTYKKQKGNFVIFVLILVILYVVYFVFLIKNGSSLCAPYQFVSL